MFCSSVHMDVQCWQTYVGSSITGLAGGFVTGEADEEYVLHTFSGAVVSFTTGSHRLHTRTPAELVQAGSGMHRRCQALQQQAHALECDMKQLTQQIQVSCYCC